MGLIQSVKSLERKRVAEEGILPPGRVGTWAITSSLPQFPACSSAARPLRLPFPLPDHFSFRYVHGLFPCSLTSYSDWPAPTSREPIPYTLTSLNTHTHNPLEYPNRGSNYYFYLRHVVILNPTSSIRARATGHHMATLHFNLPNSEDLRQLRGEILRFPCKEARKQGSKKAHGTFRKWWRWLEWGSD